MLKEGSRDLGLALYASAFSLPLVLPALFAARGEPGVMPDVWQLLLALPVQFYAGARFYRQAWSALKSGSLNTDVLLVLSTSAAFGLSVYRMSAGTGDPPYFHIGAAVITFMLWGRWFGRRAPAKTRIVQKLVDRVCGRWTVVIFVVTAIIFVLWGLWTGDWRSGVRPAIAVLVLACPCGLGWVLPTAVWTGGDDPTVLRKTKQNLFLAFVYNLVGIPLAAMGLLSPTLAGLAMVFSSVSVIVNSLILKSKSRA